MRQKHRRERARKVFFGNKKSENLRIQTYSNDWHFYKNEKFMLLYCRHLIAFDSVVQLWCFMMGKLTNQ